MTKTLALLACILLLGCTQEKKTDSESSQGDKYFNSILPDDSAILFANRTISTGMHDDGGPQYTSNFNEIYYRIAQVPHSIIIKRNRKNNQWSEPEIVSFSGQYNDGVPALRPDDSKIYFESYRPNSQSGSPKNNEDNWYSERKGEKWSKAIVLNDNVNSDNPEFGVSVSKNGTIYFTSISNDAAKNLMIFKSELKDNHHQKRILLADIINYPNAATPCIAPDESFIIFTSMNRKDGFGGGDLYVSFKDEKEEWTNPQNLGSTINSTFNDYFPSLSPDGKYLFFVSDRGHIWSYSQKKKTYKEMINLYQSSGNGKNDIYWVNTSFLDQLKPNHK